MSKKEKIGFKVRELRSELLITYVATKMAVLNNFLQCLNTLKALEGTLNKINKVIYLILSEIFLKINISWILIQR